MIIESFTRSNGVHTTGWIRLQCDTCQSHFERRKRGFHHRTSKIHFCSSECKRVSIQRNGVLRSVLDDGQSAWKTKTGYSHTFQDPEARAKREATWIENYGVKHPWSSIIVRSKIESTVEARYGVKNIGLCKEVMGKVDQVELHRKGHQTKKRNGTYGTSRIENQFYEELCCLFEQENVKRQVEVNGWMIDFYVSSIDTYVQFDGVYWHGHLRTIEELESSESKRDRVILGTKLRDVAQNVWFSDNRINLVRITDQEYRRFRKHHPCMEE